MKRKQKKDSTKIQHSESTRLYTYNNFTYAFVGKGRLVLEIYKLDLVTTPIYENPGINVYLHGMGTEPVYKFRGQAKKRQYVDIYDVYVSPMMANSTLITIDILNGEVIVYQYKQRKVSELFNKSRFDNIKLSDPDLWFYAIWNEQHTNGNYEESLDVDGKVKPRSTGKISRCSISDSDLQSIGKKN